MTIYKMNEVIWDMANNFFLYGVNSAVQWQQIYYSFPYPEKLVNISFLFAFYKPITFLYYFSKIYQISLVWYSN